MRTAHKLKMTEVRNIQKNFKEKLEKDAEELIQLMDLPDFDTSQFFQTLLKKDRYMEVLERIPEEKKVYFFAKNYQAFLETQDELLTLQLPKLEQIPKAKVITFEQQKQQQAQDNFQQSSVLQIIDTFSSAVLQKNLQETLRVFQIIQQMKKHSKYKPYFDNYSTNKIFLETYNSFIDNCNSYEVLLKINEYDKAVRVYLEEREQEILAEIKVNLNINDGSDSMAKEMLRLVQFVDKEVKIFKMKFKKEIEKYEYFNAYVGEWIKKLTKNYYSLIESYIYEKDELSDILAALNANLQKSTELESKGISLQRQLKEMIAIDLPLHISKVIEIIVDSVNQILKEKNQLYEFTYFASIKKFSTELGNLKQISKQDFGLKCATCKGIILVNSFVLILSTLCDDKWNFIHEGILDILINKIALNILNCTLHYWDYYFIFRFFERLAAGKVRHKELISGQVGPGLAEKLHKIKSLSQSSWDLFENKLASQFFRQVLSVIPQQLFSFRKYAYSLEKIENRPSTFSISLIFKVQEFFKQVQYRISESQTEYIATTFLQYILFGIEYVLFWSYHNKGSNDKVFSLSLKQDKLLKKAKEFNFLDLQDIKKRNILQLSKINKYGFLKLVFQIYLLTEVYKYITKAQKIQTESFNSRLAKVLAKDQKKEVVDTSKKQFEDDLAKMLKVYVEKPQIMHSYLKEKKKA